MHVTRRLIVMLALLPSTFAMAAETVPPVSDADPGCACVAKGKRFAQGETACVNGLRMTCGMNQNVTAWLSQGEQCNISLKLLHPPASYSVRDRSRQEITNMLLPWGGRSASSISLL